MGSSEANTVYISPWYVAGEPRDDDDDELVWSSWSDFEDSEDWSAEERHPRFEDLSEGVAFWKASGAKRILVAFDGDVFQKETYYWAGSGPSPTDPATGLPYPRFSDADPRGRHAGLIATVEYADRTIDERLERHALENRRRAGLRLVSRRNAAGISVEEVARRMGTDPQWVADLEGGRISDNLHLKTWLALVWATQNPWPDEREAAQVLPPPRRVLPVGKDNYYPLAYAEELVSEVLAG